MLSASAGSGIKRYVKEHHEALLFLFVLVLGLVAVGVGYSNLRSAIYHPYIPSSTGALADATSNLKNVDTDGDGLSDYDELNVYHTSPYLADTDSDGVPDGVELAKGTDPNCPGNQVCGSVATQSSTSSQNSSATSSTSGAATTPTAAELRSVLLQAGVPADQVNAMSDTQIIAAYQQAQSQSSGSVSSSSPSASTPTPPTSTTTVPANPTPSQIRDILRQSGVTDDKLSQISDADLLTIYQETIAQVKPGQTSSTPPTTSSK